MHDDHEHTELTERERAMFAALPRESAAEAAREDQLVDALRSEGYFRRRDSQTKWMLQLAAALALLAAGAYGGARYAERHSLERMLARTDLALADRVLLMQRAGTAYVTSMNGYADATTHVNAAAIEVATGVLLGAAQAVARRNMDGGMTASLAAMLRTNGSSTQRTITQ